MDEQILVEEADENQAELVADLKDAAKRSGMSKIDEFEQILSQQTEQMAKQCEQLKALTNEVENLRKQLKSAGSEAVPSRPPSAFEKMQKMLDRKKKKNWTKQTVIDEDEVVSELYRQLGECCQRVDSLDAIRSLVEKIDAEAQQSGKIFNPDWRDKRRIEPNSTYVVSGCFLHRLFQDSQGSSELQRLEIVRYLVDERGASVDLRQEFWGWTPLIMAARRGYRQIAEFLLSRGAYVDRTDFDGTTALIYAAKHSHIEIVKLLLQHGSEINHQNNSDRWTALMWAAVKASTEIIKLLIEQGANLQLENRNELTALKLALIWGNAEAVALLKNYDI